MKNQAIEGSRLSPQQKHLWLLQQDSQTFRAQCAVLLEGYLKEEVLKEALQAVVNRHEIFRTTFHRRPEMKIPLQVVAHSSTSSWHSVDLSGYSSQQQEAKIKEFFQEEKHHPFDFEQGPLLRLSLLALSSDKHVLLIRMPALCADSRTLKNLVDELSRSYLACLQDEELSDEPLQYVDFSEWQNDLLEAEDEKAARGKAYWDKQDISTLSVLTLPFEGRAKAQARFEPDSVDLRFDSDAVAKIEAIVQRSDSTASVLLQACWQTLLWRLTGLTDFIINTLSDGRKYEEMHGAMGLYAKWLPIRCRVEANLPFSEIVERADQSTRDARKWQEYFTPEQSGRVTVNGLDFPVGFEFAEQVSKHGATGVSFTLYKQYNCSDRFKIKLSCVRVDDSLKAELHYDPQFFGRDNIKRIAACFETLLKSALDDAETPVSELEMLSEADRHQLLVAFNQTAAEYPHDKCIHELFEQQAERTPDNMAVVFEDQQLTYAELNSRANQLARILRRQGVGPDVRVGLCVERSVEMLVGVLGILKAGGAYVPLNPEHPKARLSYQLKETQSPVLITQQKLLSQLPDFVGEIICLDRDQAHIEKAEKTNLEPISAPQHMVYT